MFCFYLVEMYSPTRKSMTEHTRTHTRIDFFSTSWQRPKIRRAAGASALAHSNLRRFAPQEANDYDLCCRRERRRFRTRVVGAQNEHQNGAAKY